MTRRAVPGLALVAMALACATEASEPELELPVLLTRDLPFGYPPDLYTNRVDGDVALYLYVDSLGLVVPESTRIAEPSVNAAFDSAALTGAPFLSFRPAQRGEQRLGHAIVLPVQFRAPREPAAKDTSAR